MVSSSGVVMRGGRARLVVYVVAVLVALMVLVVSGLAARHAQEQLPAICARLARMSPPVTCQAG